MLICTAAVQEVDRLYTVSHTSSTLELFFEEFPPVLRSTEHSRLRWNRSARNLVGVKAHGNVVCVTDDGSCGGLNDVLLGKLPPAAGRSKAVQDHTVDSSVLCTVGLGILFKPKMET